MNPQQPQQGGNPYQPYQPGPDRPYPTADNPQYPNQSQSQPYAPAAGFGQTTPQQTYGPNEVMPPLAPGQQRASGHNPYEFIVNANNPPRSGIGRDPFIKRLLVIVGIMAVLIIIGGFVARALMPKENSKDMLIGIVLQQQELVRVASMGSSASSETVRGFAANTQYSVGSDQAKLVKYLASKNVAIDKKQLALAKDGDTDTLLSDARATSTYDTALRQELADELNEYAADLASAYKVVTNPEAKETLSGSYKAAQLLLKQSGVTPTVTPTTTP